MSSFASYVDSLEVLAIKALHVGLDADEEKRLAAALDGQPGRTLRGLVPLADRRAAGAFFTSPVLGERALGAYLSQITPQTSIYDPACGVGDLLVTCARHLPVGNDLGATLVEWGRHLRGLDINPEFVRATRARLALAAVERGVSRGDTYIPRLDEAFPHVRVGDSLGELAHADGSTAFAHCIVLNPPFGAVVAPRDCTWASGRVSQAALFLEAFVRSAQPGTCVVAILPDALRAGSRYAKWRAHIEKAAVIEDVEVFGLFDPWADIDVFILRLTVGPPASPRPVVWWPGQRDPGKSNGRRVSDYFSVHVGPVVPHRHPKLGQWYPYLYARIAPAWGVYAANAAPRRRFRGTTFGPPFVVIRRTSRPEDAARAVGTIVTGERPVAVENHLLVLLPRDGSVARCEELLEVLHSGKTSRWLNDRIRCRHLTVTAVSDLPWW